MALRPDQAQAHSSLIFLRDLDPESTLAEQQEERRRWAARHAAPLAAEIRPHANDRDPERPLTIGYVSADFRRHSASCIFRHVLLNHDRARFRVHCYSNVPVADDVTTEFREAAHVWRSIVDLSDGVVAEMVRQDGVDVLVDLSGHTTGQRLLLFARKPAPVQVTAWGQVNGTGLSTIDAIFADPVYIPAADRPLFAETVVDLPCYLHFGPPDSTPAVAPSPAAGEGVGEVTFGCLNRISKVTEPVIAIWAEILRAVPGSRMVLKDAHLQGEDQRRRIAEAFAAHGVAAERLTLLGASSHAEHLAAHARVDIALDPFPQNGGISTLEAIWMGVPVVTLAGSTPSGRNGAALNAALGLHRFVAATPEAYRDIAVAMAADRAGLADLRSSLRQRLATSPLCDHQRYTRAVEDAYRGLWRLWCQGSCQGRSEGVSKSR
ncbi:MAG: hypothetical protein H7840_12760 [Alphaproteobacteria bacterium]